MLSMAALVNNPHADWKGTLLRFVGNSYTHGFHGCEYFHNSVI